MVAIVVAIVAVDGQPLAHLFVPCAIKGVYYLVRMNSLELGRGNGACKDEQSSGLSSLLVCLCFVPSRACKDEQS